MVTTSRINPASSRSKSWVDKVLEAVNGEAAVNGRWRKVWRREIGRNWCGWRRQGTARVWLRLTRSPTFPPPLLFWLDKQLGAGDRRVISAAVRSRPDTQVWSRWSGFPWLQSKYFRGSIGKKLKKLIFFLNAPFFLIFLAVTCRTVLPFFHGFPSSSSAGYELISLSPALPTNISKAL